MSTQIETINIRQATEQDFTFIQQMCYLAAFPEPIDDKPTFEEAQNLEWFQDYTCDWPNHRGDFGLVAEKEDGQPVAAAWYRDYPRQELDTWVPTHELSIAVVPEMQGRKIGERLLSSLLDGASKQGVEELILQVKDGNERAKALYRKTGFITVARSKEGYDVMVAPTASTATTFQETASPPESIKLQGVELGLTNVDGKLVSRGRKKAFDAVQ